MRWNVIADLINQRGFTSYVELGVQGGKTLRYVLENCPKLNRVVAVDLWQEQPDNPAGQVYGWAHEDNEAGVRALCDEFPGRLRVEKRYTVDAALHYARLGEWFDLVFIDADHSAQAVYNDIVQWIDLIAPHGIIAGHDYNWPSVRYVVDAIFMPAPMVEPDYVWWHEVSSARLGFPCFVLGPDKRDYYDGITATLYKNRLLHKYRD